MDQQKYRETIAKLLALAGSPNENEARAALLKAQALMAKYKISEADLRNLKDRSQEKVEIIRTDISYSGRRDPWIPELAEVIAKNYSCEFYFSFIPGRSTETVCFMGLESDVRTCESAFRYAVEYVRNRYDFFRRKYKGTGAVYIKAQYNSYAFGFVEGLKLAYEKQVAESRFELVLVIPEQVREAYDQISFSDNTAFYQGYDAMEGSGSYQAGLRDGEDFGTVRKVTGLKIEK